MKLQDIHHDAIDQIKKILPNTNSIQRLLKWARSPREYTNPSDRHNDELLQKEFSNNQRLVAMPWAVDIDPKLWSDYITILDGKIFWISKDEEILNLVINSDHRDPKSHIIRGLAFGFQPDKILEFYLPISKKHAYRKKLESLGVVLSSSYPSGGYASGVNHIVVEPGDIGTIPKSLGTPTYVTRFCPECPGYVQVSGEQQEWAIPKCPHKPIHNPELPPNKRHWYMFDYK